MDIMKSLLGIILRSKCKFRTGVKALRKLLPTWLALMNSALRLRRNTKVEDCIHVIKMINYSLKCIPFLFFLQEVCAKTVMPLAGKCCEFKCGTRQEHGEAYM